MKMAVVVAISMGGDGGDNGVAGAKMMTGCAVAVIQLCQVRSWWR
jgi:hypothetical protein